MLSLFSVLAPPPREEAKQRQGIPGFISAPRPEDRGTYTCIWRRPARRGRCASHPGVADLIKQPERVCCCSQLQFFTFFTRWVRPRHATFRVLVPVESVSPPTEESRSRDQRTSRRITPGVRNYSCGRPLDFSGMRASNHFSRCAPRI